MDKFDRFQQLHRLLSSRRRPVAIATIAEKLECSEGTAKRLIYQLRDYWQAPIEYSQQAKGWLYSPAQAESFELPGLWLTASELQSLSALLHLIQNVGEGLLNEDLQVVERSIHKLIGARGIDVAAFTGRIKFLPMAKRAINHHVFASLAEALVRRKQITLVYRDYRNNKTTRTISPQTLIYYRENWHLDAWCHLREGLRTFSLSRIEHLQPETAKAKAIPQAQLAEHFSTSFGLFAGTPKHTARLRFYPEVAREIASQQWHPEQKGEWEHNNYILSIPYNKDAELIMEILKYGNNVEVLAPAALKKRIKDKLRGALQFY